MASSGPILTITKRENTHATQIRRRRRIPGSSPVTDSGRRRSSRAATAMLEEPTATKWLRGRWHVAMSVRSAIDESRSQRERSRRTYAHEQPGYDDLGVADGRLFRDRDGNRPLDGVGRRDLGRVPYLLRGRRCPRGDLRRAARTETRRRRPQLRLVSSGV